jgi:Brp/Blh family beta-carotene 15,15'-monooxygenase
MSTGSVIACLGLIMTVGVSHGAIDNVLYQLNRRVNNLAFIAIYLAVVAINVLFWLIAPDLGLASFLIISAYHFGQSQLTGIKQAIDPLRRSLYFLWGCSLIMALVHFNRQEILAYPADFSLLNIRFFNYLVEHSKLLWLSSTLLCFVPLAIHELFINRRANYLFIQIYFMALIIVAFALFSTLTGFTLYFVILHSLRVLLQEYQVIKKRKLKFSPLKFINLLLPFTLLSILGTVAVLVAHNFLNWSISTGLLIFIIISSITLPHSYVMELFYKREHLNASE